MRSLHNFLARAHGWVDERLRDLFFALIHALHKRRNKKIYVEAEAVMRRYRREGGTLRHRYQEYKLASLVDLLESARPKLILELGGGTSTAIFANYIRKTPGARLVSVDEQEVYLEQARQVAQVEKNDERFTFLCCPQQLFRDEHGKVEKAKYEAEFVEQYDFVFIDGPSAWEGKNKNKQAVSSNIFDLLDRYKPETIVVDGRRATVDALMNHLSTKDYDQYPTDLMRGKIRPGYRYFSYFCRCAR